MTSKLMRYMLAGVLFFSFKAHSATEVKYVNYEDIGKSIEELTIHFVGATNGVLPATILVDQYDGVVVGFVLVYPRSVKLDDIKSTIDHAWQKYERKTGKSEVYAWRNEDLGFVIGVGKDENNAPSLAMRKINKRK